jgi:hypothetical protein
MSIQYSRPTIMAIMVSAGPRYNMCFRQMACATPSLALNAGMMLLFSKAVA